MKGSDIVEKAYKFRIYPNKHQKVLINKTFGCCRFVYNYYLNKRKKLYEEENISFTYNMCSKDLTSLKRELIWLKEPDKDSLQKSLKDLDQAYQKFFKEHAGYPKFKSKKNRYKSYRTSCTNNNIRFENNNYIRLPKLGLIKVRDKQIPQGKILNATISQEPDGHYYCSLCCTNIEIEQLSKTNQNIGIDLGICDFAILSNGIKIENPQFFEKSEKNLLNCNVNYQEKQLIVIVGIKQELKLQNYINISQIKEKISYRNLPQKL